MAQMLIAAFNDPDKADMAVDELEEMGYSLNDVSVIAKEERFERTNANGDKSKTDEALSGAASGAATGGVIGGIAGLLAGAGIFPALAGLLIGGPIAAALGATGVVATTVSGAVTGAVAGGLIGALMKLGMSEEDAKAYNETVEKGGVILAVPVEGNQETEVRDLFDDHGADRVQSLSISR